MGVEEVKSTTGTVPELASTDLLEFNRGRELHRSNENVCYRGQFHGRDVVVKKLILSRPDSLDKFEEEAQLLLQPSLLKAIVRPIAVVRAPPHYSIVLPFMANGDLKQLLHRHHGRLQVELILCLAMDIARALRAVHAQGIIHRDFKTANVLIDADFRAFLSDFGSAQMETQEAPGSHSGKFQPSGGFHKMVIDGTTLGYTSPEVLSNKRATQASDVYGLGIVLSEMVTGIAPYEGAEKETADMHTILDASYSEHALILAITQEHLRPNLVGYENKGMPMELLMLIRQCWTADPARRPTAQAVCETLAKILASRGIDADTAERSRFVNECSEELVHANGHFDHEEDRMEIEQNGLETIHTHRADDVAPVAVAIEEQGEDGAALKRNPFLPCGAFATSGKRGQDKMEDRHSLRHKQLDRCHNITTACVFDGHGGSACSEYANQQLPALLEQAIYRHLTTQNPSTLAARNQEICRAFVKVDEDFRKLEAERLSTKHSGTTAIGVSLWWNVANNRVCCTVANVGDGRVVACRRLEGVDTAVQLSNDHNADVPSEQARIKKSGGTVVRTADGRLRVQGHIQVTRSLGDAPMKPYGVCATPEILDFDLDPETDEFLIIATDGVFDTLTNLEAVRAVRDTAKDPGLAAKRICGEALGNGSGDNISCVVVFLKDFGVVDKIF